MKPPTGGNVTTTAAGEQENTLPGDSCLLTRIKMCCIYGIINVTLFFVVSRWWKATRNSNISYVCGNL